MLAYTTRIYRRAIRGGEMIRDNDGIDSAELQQQLAVLRYIARAFVKKPMTGPEVEHLASVLLGGI